MRIVFMGTPAFAVPALEALIAAGHRIAAVYTRAPRPAGRRGLELVPSPVHTFAQSLGLPVMTPRTLRGPEAVAELEGLAPDVLIVAAYGLILPKDILEVSKKGCLNLHASLLPRWRGAAPIERAIMAGDKETGVVVMRIVEGLDAGPVALSKKIALGLQANAGEIRDKLATHGAGLIVQALAALERDGLLFAPQAEQGVTYAPKIGKEELRIDWRRPAAEVHNLVRGLAPIPGAYFEASLAKNKERVKLLRTEIAREEGPPGLILDARPTVACGQGSVRLLEVQRPGKRPMPVQEFWHGAHIGKGTKLPLPDDAAL